MGGADVIRQSLEAQLVDELTIIVAPVVLGGGKRLFEGFTASFELQHLGVRQSAHATFIDYAVPPVTSSGRTHGSSIAAWKNSSQRSGSPAARSLSAAASPSSDNCSSPGCSTA